MTHLGRYARFSVALFSVALRSTLRPWAPRGAKSPTPHRRRHLNLAASVLMSMVLVGVPRVGHANTVITVDDLPTTLQPAFPAAIAPVSSFDAYGASAFTFSDVSTLTQKWLLRYPLFPGSVEIITDNDTGNTQQTALAGYLWLEAPAALDPANDPQEFTLYTDKVIPAPSVLWQWLGNGSATTLTLPAFDVASSGGGSFVAGLDENLESYLSGSLRVVDAFGDPGTPLCLAEGCESSATLRLTYLDYSAGTLAFDSADTRAFIYAQEAIDPYGQTVTQRYYVQLVPEPASVLAVATACVGLGWWRRRTI